MNGQFGTIKKLTLNCAIENFNWEKLLETKNVNEQFYLFNKTMLNIFHNFIPNKNMIRNDKDPPWFNKKNHLFKSYMAISRLTVALHEKPYFLSSGISWKAKKDQVNVIFPSTS